MHIFSAGPNSSDPYGKPTSPGKRRRPDEENITFAISVRHDLWQY